MNVNVFNKEGDIAGKKRGEKKKKEGKRK